MEKAGFLHTEVSVKTHAFLCKACSLSSVSGRKLRKEMPSLLWFPCFREAAQSLLLKARNTLPGHHHAQGLQKAFPSSPSFGGREGLGSPKILLTLLLPSINSPLYLFLTQLHACTYFPAIVKMFPFPVL